MRGRSMLEGSDRGRPHSNLILLWFCLVSSIRYAKSRGTAGLPPNPPWVLLRRRGKWPAAAHISLDAGAPLSSGRNPPCVLRSLHALVPPGGARCHEAPMPESTTLPLRASPARSRRTAEVRPHRRHEFPPSTPQESTPLRQRPPPVLRRATDDLLTPPAPLGAMDYGCSHRPPRADCGAENTLKAGDVIQCRECGYRILYKKRTQRNVDIEAALGLAMKPARIMRLKK
ncbi:hypothetical protein QYE76_041568 [Lolium multiflorum]|uniref:Uncharacterized protein n=1 Tax=Lolium multiflorum TaxID=4521 RepID=A0AAD8TDA5_LOLMU|nr:hypothetical protein QYE76_041568 [Lolium multiflorum]